MQVVENNDRHVDWNQIKELIYREEETPYCNWIFFFFFFFNAKNRYVQH